MSNPFLKTLLVVFIASFVLYFIGKGTPATIQTSYNPQVSITTFPYIISVTPSRKPTSSTLGMESVRVTRVIDGDTIELADGNRVRYIGIDTPETSDPRRGVQCFGREAYEKNRELVEGQTVRLERDVSEKDKYGRLLRYVWIGDIMVNELLVKEGYANTSSYPPDIKYQENFIATQRLAREQKYGLWGDVCNLSPTEKMLGSSVNTQSNIRGSDNYSCDCNKSCKDISSCDEAQYQLNNCGCKARDGDGDGIACDGGPLLCQK